jgi:hypothetical protein
VVITYTIYPTGSEIAFQFDNFAVFPTFYSVDRNAANHKILVDFLNKDLTRVERSRVSRVYLYMNPSNMPTIHALAKDMAVIFPQILVIHLVFEYHYHIVSFLLTLDEYDGI